MKLRPGIITGGSSSSGTGGSSGGSGGAIIPSFVAAGTAKNGIGSVTLPWAGGFGTVAVNDISLILIETLGSDAAPAAPSGWTEVTNSPSTDSTFTRISAFWRRVTSSDSFSILFGVSLSDAGDHQNAIMLLFRNCYQTGNPCDVTAASAAGAASTGLSAPTVTTSGTNRLVLAIATSNKDAASTAEFSAWTNAALTSIAEVADFTTTAGTGGGIGAAYGFKATAGATGATTATAANSARHAYLTIALKGQTG